MAHIVVYSYPAAGHVTPLLAIVEELTHRGHRVDWVTTDRFGERVARAGATPLLYPGSPERPLATVTAGNVRELTEAQFRLAVEPASVGVPGSPDLVLYDATVLVPAKLLGVPAVRVFPSFAVNARFQLPLPSWAGSVGPLLGELLGRFLDEHGVTASAGEFYATPDALTLAVIPARFQYSAEVFDDVVFVGPCLGRRAAETWTPPDDRPVVLVGHGSHDYADRTGAVDVDPQRFRVVGTADGWIPQPAVLRHASVFVTHAGMGSVMEALYFGVPMIVRPRLPEQEAVANRVVELGLGVRSGIREALACAARVREFRDLVRQAGGERRAADEIEGVL
jgi:UDP:flavonoid glycosyltransferase YjiC (YdhE family)